MVNRPEPGKIVNPYIELLKSVPLPAQMPLDSLQVQRGITPCGHTKFEDFVAVQLFVGEHNKFEKV
jgi:hypothetical protein